MSRECVDWRILRRAVSVIVDGLLPCSENELIKERVDFLLEYQILGLFLVLLNADKQNQGRV